MPSIERESMGAEFCTGGATTRLVAAWARIVILEAAERVVPRVEVASDVNPQGYVLPIVRFAYSLAISGWPWRPSLLSHLLY
jgi:hypothetical protein